MSRRDLLNVGTQTIDDRMHQYFVVLRGVLRFCRPLVRPQTITSSTCITLLIPGARGEDTVFVEPDEILPSLAQPILLSQTSRPMSRTLLPDALSP